MNRRRVRPSNEVRVFIAWVVGLFLFGSIFIGVFEWSDVIWHHRIAAAQHNKHWRIEYGQIATITRGVNADLSSGAKSPITATVVYTDNLGINKTTRADVIDNVRVGELVRVFISKNDKVYIPRIVVNPKDDNPLKAYQGGGWFPAFNDVFVGGFVGALISILVGFIVFEILKDGFTIRIPRPRDPTIYGMRTIPKPKRYKLVHTKDGRVIEIEIRS